MKIILIDGMSGGGKTTAARYLLSELPRTAHIGMDVLKKFISDFERGVRDNAIAREITFVMASKYLKLGISVLVEQPFKTSEDIAQYDQLAKEHGVACYKFQLYAAPEVALQRVVERTRINNGTLTKERACGNIALFEKRDHLGFEAIDTTDVSPQNVHQRILSAIGD